MNTSHWCVTGTLLLKPLASPQPKNIECLESALAKAEWEQVNAGPVKFKHSSLRNCRKNIQWIRSQPEHGGKEEKRVESEKVEAQVGNKD